MQQQLASNAELAGERPPGGLPGWRAVLLRVEPSVAAQAGGAAAAAAASPTRRASVSEPMVGGGGRRSLATFGRLSCSSEHRECAVCAFWELAHETTAAAAAAAPAASQSVSLWFCVRAVAADSLGPRRDDRSPLHHRARRATQHITSRSPGSLSLGPGALSRMELALCGSAAPASAQAQHCCVCAQPPLTTQ